MSIPFICVISFFLHYLLVFILQIFHLIGKFIPRYSFWCNYKWGIFLNFLSNSLSLVYVNTTASRVLILYSATSVNLFVSSNSLLVDFVGISMYNIMSSRNSDSFTSFYRYSITVVPFFSPFPSSTHPNLHSHSEFPQCCPCPWVIHTCSLSSPFPLFPPLPPSPLLTVSLFHVSMPTVLFCSLVYLVY